MDIDLDPAIEADLEFIAAKTLIPAADIAGALITAGLHGWAHPSIQRFWMDSGVTIGWPQMADRVDDEA